MGYPYVYGNLIQSILNLQKNQSSYVSQKKQKIKFTESQKNLEQLRAELEALLQRQGVAVDLELPYGVVGEVEALRAKTGIQVAYEDAALRVTGFAPVEVAKALQALKRRAIGRVL